MLIACVDVPVLPLQMLLWRCRDWVDLPVAVVDHDKSQGTLLWVNEVARASRVLPGMRYAVALSLEPRLRASVVSESEIRTGVAALTQSLQGFSPVVEPSLGQPGVFWIDAEGVLPLYSTHEDWGARIRLALLDLGFQAQVVVGFSRFATYAVARVAEDVLVFDRPDLEQEHACAVRIDSLDFDPKLCATLHKLGVENLGQFVDLPAKSIRRRFGTAAFEIHRLASRQSVSEVLQAAPIPESFTRDLILERPDADLARLMMVMEEMLSGLLIQLSEAHRRLSSLRVCLWLDDGSELDESLTPAAPGNDAVSLLPLIRLRLQSLRLSSGVTEVHIEVQGVGNTDRQLDLFECSVRDLSAARRALARLRAEFGDDVVVRACLREGHMPAAQFRWERFEQLGAPEPQATEEGTLVRRYYPRAVPLALAPDGGPRGWQIHPDDGPIEDLVGPHALSGGWWLRKAVRDYYYALTRSGRWLWIYRDRCRNRWFMQGEVE